MSMPLIVLSIPNLRHADLPDMPALAKLTQGYDCLSIQASFPAVTWPVHASLLTGSPPQEHGIVANGHYDRATGRLEMWTMTGQSMQRPAIWDRLRKSDPQRTSAVWFPMLAKHCSADYACMPAPVHHPDGSESLWCYTQPTPLYGELLEQLGHFPLQHFWGPLAGIASTEWIARSAVLAAKRYRPDLFIIYLPHLDYAAQKFGPDSPAASQAVRELDQVLAALSDGICESYQPGSVHWIVASEYVIQPVDYVVYPNRILRDMNLLHLNRQDGHEELDLAGSAAWCLADHQCGHIYVLDRDPAMIDSIARSMQKAPGVARVLTGDERAEFGIRHESAGDVVLIAEPNSWFAYYWWQDDSAAPPYARTVDIHRKPGYDPVELFWDREAHGVPLRPELIRGSHGVPATSASHNGPLLCPPGWSHGRTMIRDCDVFKTIYPMCWTT